MFACSREGHERHHRERCTLVRSATFRQPGWCLCAVSPATYAKGARCILVIHDALVLALC